ncbi:MAG: MFS transporter [Firmicutes bacterium]|nr:MFS transporter [Bacillota bacterium]
MRQNGLYKGLYTFSYMAIGVMTPMIGQYLSSIGFSGAETGVITSAGTFMGILAVAFWGRVFNESSNREGVIACICLGAIISAGILKEVSSFAIVTALFVIMYFFQAPVISLTDAYTVGTSEGFGGKRAWGAAGFSVGVFITGLLAEETGISTFFYLYIAAFALTCAVIWDLRRTGGGGKTAKSSEGKKKGRYSDLLKDRKTCMFILCTFFMGGTNVANNTYFGFLYTDGGGTLSGIGAAFLLMAGSEIPFMAWCEKLVKKFTAEKMITFAMVISTGRFLLYGTGLPWWVLLATFFLQGAVNGIILVEFVRYVAAIAPSGCENLAISAYYLFGSNISTIVCQFVGGILLDSFGARGVYIFFGLFNLAGILVFTKFKRKSKKDVDKGYRW